MSGFSIAAVRAAILDAASNARLPPELLDKVKRSAGGDIVHVAAYAGMPIISVSAVQTQAVEGGGVASYFVGLNVTGGTTLSNGLSVSGNAVVSGASYVAGNASFSNALNASGYLNVLGASTLSNGLTVFGGTTMLSNNLNVSGNAVVSGIASFNNTVNLSKDLNVIGVSVLSNGLTVFGGSTTINNNLSVSGTFSANKSLIIASSSATNVQGTWLTWNRDGTSGKSYFINQYGSGGGGLSFGKSTTADAYAELMALSSSGALSGLASVTATTFTGSLTGNVTGSSGSCTGSSSSCSGNAATSSSCSGNAASASSLTGGPNITVGAITIGTGTVVARLYNDPLTYGSVRVTGTYQNGWSGICTENQVYMMADTSGNSGIWCRATGNWLVYSGWGGANYANSSGSCSGNAATSSSCSGNAATSSSCSGNAATSSSCSGNSTGLTGSPSITVTTLQVNSEAYCSNWFRSRTWGTGWYHELGGGGWNMTDSTYMRCYGEKTIYTGGNVQVGGYVLSAGGSWSGSSSSCSGNAASASGLTGSPNITVSALTATYLAANSIVGSSGKVNILSYWGQDANGGIGLFTNGADGSSGLGGNGNLYQGGLESWWGIGFRCKLDGITRFLHDSRNGNTSVSGSIQAKGQILCISSSGAQGTSYSAGINFTVNSDQSAVICGDISGHLGFSMGIDIVDYKFKLNMGVGQASGVFDSTPDLVIDGSGNLSVRGYVGIGTASPSYPVHVAVIAGGSVDGGYYFSTGTSSLAPYGAGQQQISIYAAGYILSKYGFLASSDRRIKERITVASSNLSVIDNINVVSYQYIDKVVNGNATKVGYIAQEVADHLPDAVSKRTDWVADLFQTASGVDIGRKRITLANHHLTVDTTIKLVNISGDARGFSAEVSEVIDADTFAVRCSESLESQVFVYGRQVDDFHDLDYDMLSAVAFGGVKELHAKYKELKEEVACLKRLMLSITSVPTPPPETGSHV